MEYNFNTQIVSNIKGFFYEIENYQTQFQYVSVTVCEYLKAKYKETYESAFVVKCLNLEEDFCRNNKLSKAFFEEFLDKYVHTGDIIDAHNKLSIVSKSKTNKSNLNSVTGKDVAKIVVDACLDISVKYLYGSTMLVNVLKGNRPKGLVESGFEKSVYFSALKDIRTADIAEIVNILVKAGVMNKTEGMYPVVSVNMDFDFKKLGDETISAIEAIVRNNLKVKSKKHFVSKTDDRTTKYGKFDIIINKDGEVLTDVDLLKKLDEVRTKIMKEKNLTSFVVASNKILVRIATEKPKTKEEFLSVKGVGKTWFENYGSAFLNIINK